MGRIQGDLPERTHEFARGIVGLARQLPPGTEGWTIGRQLLKCGTSIGANVCEADAALTTREFISCCNIARREALETRFLLRLCRHELILPTASVDTPLAEVDELGRILTTIVRRSRDHDGG